MDKPWSIKKVKVVSPARFCVTLPSQPRFVPLTKRLVLTDRAWQRRLQLNRPASRKAELFYTLVYSCNHTV
jgi:hypothetical protein